MEFELAETLFSLKHFNNDDIIYKLIFYRNGTLNFAVFYYFYKCCIFKDTTNKKERRKKVSLGQAPTDFTGGIFGYEIKNTRPVVRVMV